MAEVVNLRLARKRAGRVRAEAEAAVKRLAHGTSRGERNGAERRRAETNLDQHHLGSPLEQQPSIKGGDRI